MWSHYCPIEKTEMDIGIDEPCNWCGEFEPRVAEPVSDVEELK